MSVTGLTFAAVHDLAHTRPDGHWLHNHLQSTLDDITTVDLTATTTRFEKGT
ncbi:MAG: hypothetical protein R3C12_19310 [Planctomycetaceae bacterium]